MGDQIRINAKRQLIPVGRGGAGGDWMIYADTFAGLPTPTVVNQFARITTGTDKGMTCVVNADANGWVPFTHFG